MSILDTIKKPYKIFADVNTIEFGALQQFVDTMNQPSVTYGALMPDAHQGYTVPIGCVFSSDGVWIIIHSGSRGVGHGCAEHYMKLASPNGKASEGFFGFDVNSKNGQDYIKDMNWCLEFALQNRNLMIYDALAVIEGICTGGIGGVFINRNHNHAETKDGKNWVHRKGATHAEYGMMGVVPGNMRDGSFIVRGLGNTESLCSSSHGAGRVMGRGKAKKILDEEVFKTTMKGIIANVGQSTLDESPMAYKDIFDVMDAQSDLVEIVAHVKPILNVKG
jgi:tRNA-splicing ligase RtcB